MPGLAHAGGRAYVRLHFFCLLLSEMRKTMAHKILSHKGTENAEEKTKIFAILAPWREDKLLQKSMEGESPLEPHFKLRFISHEK